MSTKAGFGALAQRGASMAQPRPPMELGMIRGAASGIKGGDSLKGPLPPSGPQLRTSPFSGNRGVTGAPHQPMPGGTLRTTGGMAGGDSLMVAPGSSFFPGINGTFTR